MTHPLTPLILGFYNTNSIFKKAFIKINFIYLRERKAKSPTLLPVVFLRYPPSLKYLHLKLPQYIEAYILGNTFGYDLGVLSCTPYLFILTTTNY